MEQPMIRFFCPRCRAVLEAPNHRSGDKIHCPKCHQRLQIPGPPKSQTVLASVVPKPIVIDPCQLQSTPKPAPSSETDPHSPGSTDPLYPSSPKTLKLRLVLMFLVAVVSAAMLVALVVFGLSMLAFPKGTPNPFPDISHLGWTAGTDTASVGDLAVGVLLVEQHKGFLAIHILIENKSDRKKIEFPPGEWVSELSIKDEFDNQYRFIESGHPFLKGFLAFTGLSPGEYVILPAGGLAGRESEYPLP